jgi:hypothetical protein
MGLVDRVSFWAGNTRKGKASHRGRRGGIERWAGVGWWTWQGDAPMSVVSAVEDRVRARFIFGEQVEDRLGGRLLQWMDRVSLVDTVASVH